MAAAKAELYNGTLLNAPVVVEVDRGALRQPAANKSPGWNPLLKEIMMLHVMREVSLS
jgi:hypothetical protein